MDEKLGQDLGSYRVEGLLGLGGFARVYRVRHKEYHVDRALKVLGSELFSGQQREDVFKRFQHEYERLHALDHPHLAKAYHKGVLPSTGQHYIELALVEGQTLEAHVQPAKGGASPLSPEQALELGLQLVGALAYLHKPDRGDALGAIIHRDLSPSNVMLGLEEGDKLRATILDFGLSRGLGELSSRTLVQGMCYMAPEQLARSTPDARVDLYQLGALLHFGLTGQAPYSGALPEILRQQEARRHQSGPRPSEYRPSLGEAAPALDAWIGRLLSTDPAQRPATARAALQELLEVKQAPRRVQQQAQQVQQAPPSSGRPRTVREQEPQGSSSGRPRTMREDADPPRPPLSSARLAEEPGTRRDDSDDGGDEGGGFGKWLGLGLAALVLGGLGVALVGWFGLHAAQDDSDDDDPPKERASERKSKDEGEAPTPKDEPNTTPPSGMVYIPPGPFIRGSTNAEAKAAQEQCPDCNLDDEGPQRQIELSGFFLDAREVTVAQYNRCVQAGACSAPSLIRPSCSGDWAEYNNWTPEGPRPGRESHPVNCIDWRQARTYCEWAGHEGGARRLPTEAEWERAARGTEGEIYPWGNTPPGKGTPLYGNFADETAKGKFSYWTIAEGYTDGHVGTAPVGSFEAGKTEEGAYDMGGNVCELVQDCYGSRYYHGASNKDPKNDCDANSASHRVYRGGGWTNRPVALRSARRGDFNPGFAFVDLGVRCARSIE